MKAAIEKALSNVSQNPSDHTCNEASAENRWHARVNDFRRKRLVSTFPLLSVGPVSALLPSRVCLSSGITNSVATLVVDNVCAVCVFE